MINKATMRDAHSSAENCGMRVSSGDVRIFRLENRAGIGAGASGLALHYYNAAYRAIEEGREPPAPLGYKPPGWWAWEDQLHLFVRPQQVFGCTNVADLRLWFPSPAGCEAMARAGGLLREYVAPSWAAMVGITRVYFNPAYAKRLTTLRATAIHGATDNPALLSKIN